MVNKPLIRPYFLGGVALGGGGGVARIPLSQGFPFPVFKTLKLDKIKEIEGLWRPPCSLHNLQFDFK